MQAVIDGQRPTIPSESRALCGLDDVTWDLMNQCWNTIPSERPVAKKLVGVLSSRPGASSIHHDDHGWDGIFMLRLRSVLGEDPFAR
jgi:hypothetical protein